MSTYMPKAGDITRKWYVLDADGKTLGAVAAEAATLLRGKHKPTSSMLRRLFLQVKSLNRRCTIIIQVTSVT